jgi:hypothetical protein
VDKISFFPLPAFVMCVIDDNHSYWSEVKSHCHFDLYFPYSQGYWECLQIFIGHLYFFFWELHVPFICPVGLWLIFWAPYIFWVLIPYQIYSWQTFWHSVGCIFSLVTVSFAGQELSRFIQSHLSILSLNCCAIGVPFIKLLPIPMWSMCFLLFPRLISLFQILHWDL